MIKAALRVCGLLIVAGLIAACSNQNTSWSTIQLSGDTMPYPENYQAEAARIVAQRGGDPASASVSQPQSTLGATAFAPQRWYVCVRGLSQAPRPARLPKPMELVDQLFDSRASAGIHNVILVFGAPGRRPTVREGYDSPLCHDGRYEMIVAAPPTT